MTGIAVWAGLAFILSAGATSLLLRICLPLFARYALARPNARSSHKVPTPQGGGAVVVLCSLGFGIAIGIATQALLLPWLPFALLALGLAVLGAMDDLKSLGWRPRLIVQALCVGGMLLALPAEWRLVEAMPLLIERLAALVLGLWFVNLTNFMDGIDGILVVGLLPLFVAVGSGFFGLFQPDPLAMAFAGGLAGFFVLNRPPARIFAGDVGSLAIGFAAATLLFQLACGLSLIAALLLPLYFVLDASWTLLLRIRRKENLAQAHRDHAYQQAVDGGMPVWRILTRILALNLLLAVLAGAAIAAPELGVATLIGGTALTALLILHFRRVKP